MRFGNVMVAGLGYVDAPHVVRSEQLEEQLGDVLVRAGLHKGLLYALTGIAERRFWDVGAQVSAVAARAGALALDDAAIGPEQVGVLVSTSVCKDFVEPSVASAAHGLLGLSSDCLNFDVGNACLGFLNGMQVVGDMIERGHIDYGLIVDGEGSRPVVEATIARMLQPGVNPEALRNQLATFTLGSGAAAIVLARRELAPNGHRLVGAVNKAATQYNDLCRGQVDSMETDAGNLLVRGIELAADTFALAREQLGWHPDVLDELVVHQVSAVHTAKFAERLSLDSKKIFKLYPTHGNIGPASIPIALCKAREAGRLFDGARVALMGIGSGLNCSMMEVLW
ncbi:MAG: 3-oxoacyl-ACP synthase III [Bradymonadaceae bacterium]|nr:3-oxoacyl-ACP synthase III [Lujinxingiaceae bacterium]